METLKLEISKKIYQKVLNVLKQFNPEDLRVVEPEKGKESFIQEKKHLQKQLAEMDSGKAKFISTAELDELLERTIESHENKSS